MATQTYHIHASVMDRLGNRDNLRNLWELATVEDIDAGTGWYAIAGHAAHEYSRRFGISVHVAATIIAVLSPKCEWEQNLLAAEYVIMAHAQGVAHPEYVPIGVKRLAAEWSYGIPFGCLKVNVLKAFWILDGHLEALQGPKVTDFRDNILAVHEVVTVDSHYVMAWLGLVYPGTYGFDECYHAIITEDTAAVALEVGMDPAAFQAVLWTVKKRVQPKTGAAEAIKIMDTVRRQS